MDTCSTLSMTGYGRREISNNGRTVIVEIKTLNSQKGSEVFVRMPNWYRPLEIEIRKKVATVLKRGKIEVNISEPASNQEQVPKLNTDLIKGYIQQINALKKDLNLESKNDYIGEVLRLPEVLIQEDAQLTEEEEESLWMGIEGCLKSVKEFRGQEGEKLHEDVSLRVTNIKKLLVDVSALDATRISRIKDRIKGRLQEILEENAIDESRLEQELIYYTEKLDISEEKQRLEAHCDYFLETLEGEKEKGKKLNFICQEIGREINTTGSKANDQNIQKLVVQMKDELEKAKEQCANIL